MRYLPKYLEYLNKGAANKIYNIDDDWILKTPLGLSQSLLNLKTEKEILNYFITHINIMKNYPEIFPKIKVLDRMKTRVAVEKVDVEEAKKQIEHIYYYLYNYMPSIRYNDFLDYIISEEGVKFLPYLQEGDEICQNWFNFITKLRNTELFKKQRYIDAHDENFGIDKNGDIKLIDF